MKLLLLAIVLLLIGCNQQPKPTLTLADLKFADYEREWIAKNGVDTTYRTEEFDRNADLGPEPDTSDITVYNKLGQPIYYERPGFWAGCERYKYDSLGFVLEKTDQVCIDVISRYKYEFSEDGLLLKQVVEYKSDDKWENVGFIANYFNTNGQIIKRIEGKDTTKFFYNNKHQLIKIVGKEKYKGDRSKFEKSIFYQDRKPHFVITKHLFVDSKLNYKTTTYYDSKGLKYKEIERDTIITYYKHKKRK